MQDKSKKAILVLFYLITSCIVFIVSSKILITPEQGFFKKIGFIILLVTIFDMFFYVVEFTYTKIKNISNKIYLNKKNKKKFSKNNDNVSKDFSKYVSVYMKNIDSQIADLKSLKDKDSIRYNERKIESILSYLEHFLENVTNETITYDSVSMIFELYLPKFTNALKIYDDISTNSNDLYEYSETLKNLINSFNDFLYREEKKIETKEYDTDGEYFEDYTNKLIKLFESEECLNENES